MYNGDEPDVAINAFYVPKSLLLQNSMYFNIILDSSPERTTVRLPLKDHRILADWLDLIYQGNLSNILAAKFDPDQVKEYFEFADLMGSEILKNSVMDSIQKIDPDYWTLEDLSVLESYGNLLSRVKEYVLECLASKIAVRGWAGIIDKKRGDGENDWATFVGNEENLGLLNNVLLKVDELNATKRSGGVFFGNGCKWHEHLSDETKANCPGSKRGNFHSLTSREFETAQGIRECFQSHNDKSTYEEIGGPEFGAAEFNEYETFPTGRGGRVNRLGSPEVGPCGTMSIMRRRLAARKLDEGGTLQHRKDSLSLKSATSASEVQSLKE